MVCAPVFKPSSHRAVPGWRGSLGGWEPRQGSRELPFLWGGVGRPPTARDRKIRPSTRAATFQSRGGSCASALRHLPAACRLSRGLWVRPAPSIQVPSPRRPRQPPARMRCWQRWSTLKTVPPTRLPFRSAQLQSEVIRRPHSPTFHSRPPLFHPTTRPTGSP